MGNRAARPAWASRVLSDAHLCVSAGLREVNDPAELIGCTFSMQAGRYLPTTDEMQEAA